MRLRRPDLGSYDPDAAGDATASVFGLPWAPEECTLRLVGVPWEATTSYGRGTAGGPAAIARASAQLDLLDLDGHAHGLGRPWTFGIHLEAEDPEVVAWNAIASAAALPVIAAGGPGHDPELRAALARVNELSATLDRWVEARVGALLGAGHLVGLVGGDHSVPLGAIRAVAAHHGRPFGVLHIDAHADLREAYEGFEGSHASIMHNVLASVSGVERLVQVAIRDQCEAELRRVQAEGGRVVQFTERELRIRRDGGRGWASICDEIVATLPELVYLSFDIDGLDPALCPHTGTPVPGGLDFGQAVSLLDALLRSGRRLIGFDLCEVAPGPAEATGDSWDANVGARVLYKLCGALLHGAGARDEPSAAP